MRALSSLVVVGVILAGLCFVACAEEAAPAAEKMVAKVGQPAPDFTLKDQNDEKVSLSAHKGKIVVLEWINPDCPIATRHYEVDTMRDLDAKYRDKGVVWIAVNSTHYMGTDDDNKWIKKYEIPYRVLSDKTGAVGHLYAARTTPHMYIVDAAGTLVYQGAIDDDPRGRKEEKLNYVAQALDELLAGKPVSVAETKAYGCSVKYAK